MKRNTTKQQRSEAGRLRAAKRAKRDLPFDGMGWPISEAELIDAEKSMTSFVFGRRGRHRKKGMGGAVAEIHEAIDIVFAPRRSLAGGKRTQTHTYTYKE